MYKLTIIPFNYFIQTRLNSRFQKISWIFVYFIPNIFLYMYVTNFEFSVDNIVIMIAGITLVNYIYENGYIHNDIVLTKTEKEPNLRVFGKQLDDTRKKIKQIFFIRFFVLLVLLFSIWVFTNNEQIFFTYVLISIFLQSLYFIYNNIRNIWNLYLIVPLSYIRFYGFIIPFVSFQNLNEFVLMTILLYPLSKFLEFTKQVRYDFPKLSKVIGNIDTFRVIYYFIVLLITIFCFYLFNSSIEYIFVASYYLLFRIATFIAINNSKIIKEETLNNTKSVYRE